MERAAYWGVGNGWAIAGMVRVLYLLPETMDAERKQLLTWIKQALDGVLVYQRPDGLFHDVLDDPSTFVDANVAQQVAYSIFRLAEHGDVGEEYLEKAIQSREAAHRRVDQFGLVQGVCGSPSFNSSGTA
jgi:rhamnogalacturonyl hydrolase YesR